MSRIRTTSRTRLLVAAATVALAGFSLTACDNNTGLHVEGAAPAASVTTPSSPSAPSPSAPSPSVAVSGSGPVAGKTTSTGSRPTAHGTTAKAPVSSGKPVTCEGSNTKTVAALLNRPLNHMLLTVTNTGSKRCYLYGYPAVAFGEAQSVPPVIEESKPQAVVTLEPGQSGYASVSLSTGDGSAEHGHTEKSLAVYFQGRSGNESVGSGAHPSLPSQGVYIDDSLKVTYWQPSLDTALDW
ncbi:MULTISPECIES: DUF4232 domain-containing protein [Streptomycetaceae]|uniref:DUF4232 domain-containing protein n=1 Tax=Streptantibioticus cattleyicolor (strain ATCC 35852 / DSM 46488 / JCM 4925 / NBRC 14057 / NRRL 8057) TaxID=1003195 RepID=F8JSE8_STREN|nr:MULTISPECIES: DUF4232 domain-containing protein [Streptomycetaceae]AEW95465.1 hypothetical protein SCATT_30940 [Streptantibioticus cattleyicolor NRRL 8057 = DSM 46488]MYS60031.1 DUF4232 domain-containing protein [Streptomyces sp. SID5468]CCB75807.1 conserved exported protein of unknown function [Streptantibioticus cattleyicolor NRRL 8057 = DSM 46488]